MKNGRHTLAVLRKSTKLIREICPGILGLTILGGLLSSIRPFVPIVLSAQILEGILKGEEFSRLVFYIVLMVGLNFLITAIVQGLQRCTSVLQLEFDQRYEFLLNQKIMDMDYARIEDVKTHQMREKIDEIRNMNGGGIHMVLTNFPVVLQHMMTVVVALSLLLPLIAHSANIEKGGILGFAASGWAILLLGILFFINIGISIFANTAMTGHMYEIMNDILPFNRVFGYYLDNYISTYHAGKDIRIYEEQPLIREESMALFDDCRRTLNRLSRNEKKYMGYVTCSSVIVNTLIYLLVGLRTLAGTVAAGMILQYVGSLQAFQEGFLGIMTSLAELRANTKAMEALYDFLELPSSVQKGEKTLERKKFTKDTVIEFKDVSFHYPDSEEMVLKHLSVKINAGTSTAIVGANGSGKSTFIKLLCRLYEPTEGEILINGIPVEQYDRKAYQDCLSVVFQDFSLFSFPLEWNVSSQFAADEGKVERCLRAAGFGSRLERLEQGIHTPLYRDFDEQGVEISGGEAQKIALARALYKDAPVVVLDEPTAALDPLAEYDFYVHLKEIAEGKTSIYISHRLSSCRFCQQILVFEKGKLVQQGNHDSLVREQGGTYYELWNAQAQYYMENETSAQA